MAVFDGELMSSRPFALGFVLLQPIISLLEHIRSTETMSRCSRAPPKRRKTDQEKYNRQGGSVIFPSLTIVSLLVVF